MAYKHVIRAKTKNLLSDISVQSPVGVSYDKQSGIFTINSNDKTSIGYSDSVMDFITPIPVGAVITVSIYCISGRYRATQGDNTAIGGYHKYTSSTDLNTWQGLVRLPSGTDLSGKTFTTTWTVTKPLDAFWIYAPRHTDIIEEDIKFRAQLELGSTPTPYTPYNYLQSNKRMIKVSEVCQLLDKSKYNLPRTESGLTFTAGNDGSIIVNGTCTSTVWANIFSFELNPEHTFILIGCPGTNVNDVALYTLDPVGNDSKQWEEGKGSLVTGNWYKHKNNELWIRILTGYACNNLTFKPQLFDLTEMFGAGHEPATVAEFRQRFPNEYYPYSPQCWLTSYKSVVVCKTKNLFNVNNADVTYYDGYWRSNVSYTGNFYTLTVEPEKTYTVRLDAFSPLDKSDGLCLSVQTGTHFLDGNLIIELIGEESTQHWYSHTRTFTVPAGFTQVTLSTLVGVRFRNLQIEQGSTATSYVPYQHL